MKAILSMLLLVLSCALNAGETIVVTNPWVNRTPPSMMRNAGYMTITNNSDKLVRLQTINSLQFGMSHLHQTISENGLVKMMPVPGLEIPANEAVILEPGGYHIMLMNRTESLSQDDEVEIKLLFSDGQEITVKAPVR